MKEMLKLGLTLAIFAAVACVALAFVNNLTAPTIAKVEQEKANAGMKTVFADADTFEEVAGFTSTVENGVTIDKVCYAIKNGTKIGVVVQATGNTYDKATILVGINADKVITGINFLAISSAVWYSRIQRCQVLQYVLAENRNISLPTGRVFFVYGCERGHFYGCQLQKTLEAAD